MADLVTLEEAKLYLRVDGSIEDDTIAALVTAASDAVIEIANTWDGEGEPPERLRIAALMLVADWFDHRSPVSLASMPFPMPHGVTWLLQSFRTLEA